MCDIYIYKIKNETLNPHTPHPTYTIFGSVFERPSGENTFPKNAPSDKSVPYRCGGAQNAQDMFDKNKQKEKHHIHCNTYSKHLGIGRWCLISTSNILALEVIT